MIAGIFHKGSGLGNQLHRYVITRVIAEDRGFTWGMQSPELFKGSSFLRLPMGLPVRDLEHLYVEKKITLADGTDIRDYDWDGVRSITDHTLIDGEFQGEDYFKHRKNDIRSWLAVDALHLPENVCVINFRGGEYVGTRELFLPLAYWQSAIAHMRAIRRDMEFRIVTDDIKTAKKFFPGFEISHNVEHDYRAIQSATYLILSNSSFAFFPAWLNEKVRLVIAPKYWARHNVSDGYWSCAYNMVDGWMYQDRDGVLHDYHSCIKDLAAYQQGILCDNTSVYFPPIPLRKKVARFIPARIKKLLRKFL